MQTLAASGRTTNLPINRWPAPGPNTKSSFFWNITIPKYRFYTALNTDSTCAFSPTPLSDSKLTHSLQWDTLPRLLIHSLRCLLILIFSFAPVTCLDLVLKTSAESLWPVLVHKETDGTPFQNISALNQRTLRWETQVLQLLTKQKAPHSHVCSYLLINNNPPMTSEMVCQWYISIEVEILFFLLCIYFKWDQ